MGGIGIWQLVIILVIILVVFGTKKFKNIGTDLGGAIKGFKKSMSKETDKNKSNNNVLENEVIENEASSKETK